jgi:hypothetical protein
MTGATSIAIAVAIGAYLIGLIAALAMLRWLDGPAPTRGDLRDRIQFVLWWPVIVALLMVTALGTLLQMIGDRK